MQTDQPASAPRVLMLIKALDTFGGGAVQLRQLARNLCNLGVGCHIVARYGKSVIDDPALAGIRVTRLKSRRSREFYQAVERLLIEDAANYDIIHVHGHGTLSLTAARAARRVGGKPVVVKVTAAGNKSRLSTWEFMARRVPCLRRRLALHATCWIALSAETRRGLERLGVPPERIVAIPNGVDETLFRPASAGERSLLRQRFGVTEDTPLVITVGGLKWRKRMDRTIAAFNEAFEKIGRGKLWIIGDGPDREALRQLAASGPASQAIEFLGPRERAEVAERLQSADIFVLPSEIEGLSNAVLEAMSCGLPVLVSALSGNEDLIRHGENGILIGPKPAAGLAVVLSDLMENSEKAARLGAAARETILQSYSMESVARRLLALYRRLCSGEVATS